MIWSPNIGIGYPFVGAGFEGYTPQATDTDPKKLANFAVLNTDNLGPSAGLLTGTDDPYGPYYPGDEWVDWIGISSYSVTGDINTKQSTPAPPDVFTDPASKSSLVGTLEIQNFYRRFVQNTGKPFIFSETGAAYQRNVEGSNFITPDADPAAVELSVKQAW